MLAGKGNPVKSEGKLEKMMVLGAQKELCELQVIKHIRMKLYVTFLGPTNHCAAFSAR